jgi:hypothetical protein
MTVFRTARGRPAHGEGGDGREEPTSQLHTCLEGKVVEEIGDILQCGGGTLGGDHQFGCCGFGGRNFDPSGWFLLLFRANSFVAAVGFSSGFLVLAAFLVAVNLACLGVSVTG